MRSGSSASPIVIGLWHCVLASAVSPAMVIVVPDTMCWSVPNMGMASARNAFVLGRSPTLPPNTE